YPLARERLYRTRHLIECEWPSDFGLPPLPNGLALVRKPCLRVRQVALGYRRQRITDLLDARSRLAESGDPFACLIEVGKKRCYLFGVDELKVGLVLSVAAKQ